MRHRIESKDVLAQNANNSNIGDRFAPRKEANQLHPALNEPTATESYLVTGRCADAMIPGVVSTLFDLTMAGQAASTWGELDGPPSLALYP